MKHFFNGWLAVGLGLIAFGGAATAIFSYYEFRQFQFRVEKVSTTMRIVTSHERVKTGDKNGYSLFGDHCICEFTYRDAAEHKHSGSVDISLETYMRIQDGQPIEVHYLEASPDIYQLPNTSLPQSIIGFPIIILGCLIATIGIQDGLKINRLLRPDSPRQERSSNRRRRIFLED